MNRETNIGDSGKRIMEEKNEGRDVRLQIEQDNDETVNNKNEEVIVSRGVLVDKSGVTNLDIWQHFKIWSLDKNIDVCQKRRKEVNIGATQSTGHLKSHLRTNHRIDYDSNLSGKADLKLSKEVEKVQSKINTQNSLTSYFSPAPISQGFLTPAIDWTVAIYQHNDTSQNIYFREMQSSLNPKAEFIGN